MVLGFDVNYAFYFKWQQFVESEDYRDKFKQFLSVLYRDLKGMAYINRDNDWKLPDGREAIVAIFNQYSKLGEMTSSKFYDAACVLLAPTKPSRETIDAIFLKIRIKEKTTYQLHIEHLKQQAAQWDLKHEKSENARSEPVAEHEPVDAEEPVKEEKLKQNLGIDTGILQMGPHKRKDRVPELFGYVTLEEFRKLKLPQLHANISVEFVKTLYIHIQVLENIIDGGVIQRKKNFNVEHLMDTEAHETVRRRECARLCLVSNYNIWWDHFESDRAKICVLYARNLINDTIVYGITKDEADQIRRIFRCNSFINSTTAATTFPYNIIYERVPFQVVLNNASKYVVYVDPQVNKAVIDIGTEYHRYGDLRKFRILPDALTPFIMAKIRSMRGSRQLPNGAAGAAGGDDIGGVHNNIILNCKIYDRESVKIKFEDGTCVDVPLDPKLVLQSITFTDTENDKIITKKFSADVTFLNKYTWNFNTSKWEDAREIYALHRNANILHSAVHLHNAMKSNDICRAAQHLRDIMVQVQSNTSEKEAVLKTWCVQETIVDVQSGNLHKHCSYLQKVANERNRMLQNLTNEVTEWRQLEAGMKKALRIVYPCLAITFYEVLQCMGMKDRVFQVDNIKNDIGIIASQEAARKNTTIANVTDEVSSPEANVLFTCTLPFSMKEFNEHDKQNKQPKRDKFKEVIKTVAQN
jgi:hypothetical protein